MAVVVASATRSADALISYALDDKPDQQGERYVMASGVGGLLVSVAKQQMRDVRKKWGKDKPGAFVHAYHVIQSFGKDEVSPEDPDSWMMAQRLGRALAKDRFPGRHVLIVTQRDGRSGCIHNHLVINSIETKTGKSLDSSIVMHSRLVEAHERVLEAEGFEQRADLKQAFSDATDRRERGEPSGLRRADSTQQSELREFQRHILWEADNEIADDFGGPHKPEPFSVTVLKSSIERTLADPAAVDWTSFVEVGRRHCVRIEQRGKKGRGISYGMLREQPDSTLAEPSASDRRRCSTLGTSFEMDAVEQALERNSTALQSLTPAAPVIIPATPPTLATVQDKPVPRKPSANERLRIALDEVNEQADVNTQRMIADYITAKASSAKPQEPGEVPDQSEPSASVKVPGAVPLSELRDAQEAQAAAELAPGPVDGAEAAEEAEATSDAQTAQEDAEKLRKINEQSRRLGLPSVSPEQYAADQAMSPEQRTQSRKHPELFDDTTPAAEPGEQGHVFRG